MLPRIAARYTLGFGAFRRPVSIAGLSTSAVDQNQVKLLGKNNPESVFYEGPERDLVNFPRRKMPIENPPVRLGFLPEEWFQFFYPKTGVTGPYMFIASFGTYLISKEIWVLEHEFYTGLGFMAVMATVYKFAGEDIKAYKDSLIEKDEKKLRALRMDEIDRCKEVISEEEKAQWMATSWETLIQAKKENVGLQLEAAYRDRLQNAFTQVKRRLDYQAETTNVARRSEQKHMVEWILSNVRKSITPKLEEDAMKKCVSDLKGLAATV